jgi:TfoX/Sxy family transcriptional regulator of competence genes
MAYDERLAGRISELIHARPGVVERKMFGGLGWMIGGNMAIGIMREDHLIVRLAPEEIDEAVREPHVHEFGRPGAKPMKGFVLIDPEVLDDDATLAHWVDRGAERALELPPK